MMKVTHWIARVLLAAIVTGPSIAGAQPGAATQTDRNKAAIQARLNKVRAALFSATNRPEESARELKEILAIDPQSAEAHLLLGIAYRTIGSADFMGEAVAELRQALEIDPSYVPARLYLAHIYLDLGRFERAREEIQAALEKVPGNPQFLTLLGETERQLGNPRRSLEVLNQALEADQTMMQARYYLGLTLLDLKRSSEAIKELERVVQAGETRADVYLSLGAAYLESARIDEGLEILSKATRIEPTRPDIRIQLARAYRLKGLLDKAESQLALGVPQASSVASPFVQHRQLEFDLYMEQGLLRQQRGQLTAAEEAFKKVLQIDSDYGLANRALAEVYLRRGLYARSLEYATRSEKLGFPLPADKRKALEDGLLKQKKQAGGER
jgi:tetratricopeptide (TPR) repeat protein